MKYLLVAMTLGLASQAFAQDPKGAANAKQSAPKASQDAKNATQSAPKVPPTAGKEHTISQKGKAFSVAEISVAAGDTLVFKNDDDTAHNVFSAAEPMKFNLGIQKPGNDASHTFDKAGVAELRCAIHPKMKIKVTVK